MDANSFRKVFSFFQTLGDHEDMRGELSKYDQVIQFRISGEQPFLIRVRGGKVSSELDEIKDPGLTNCLIF